MFYFRDIECLYPVYIVVQYGISLYSNLKERFYCMKSDSIITGKKFCRTDMSFMIFLQE